jgi:hypothetical protein
MLSILSGAKIIFDEDYMMKSFAKVLFAGLISSVATVSIAAAKTYQVTGPVLEVTPTGVVVQKGSEKWEIQKDAAAKIPTELKVGDKVTIEYTMTAKSVEIKTGKPAKK